MIGYEKFDCRNGYSCVTVFSASNYDGAGNDACFLKLTVDASGRVSRPSPTVYHSSHHDVEATKEKNRKSITDLINKNRAQIEEAFEAFENSNSNSPQEGHVTPEQWCDIMAEALNLQMAWANLQPSLAPLSEDTGLINWHEFLEHYQVSFLSGNQVGRRTSNQMGKLYSNHRTLLMMFDYFDTDGDGKVSKQDWKQGCDWVNAKLAEGEEALDGHGLFQLLDFYDSGVISRNEFCEGFRISTSIRGT